MDDSNINWILAIACLLAGIGIGAAGHHWLNAGASNLQRLRRRLAERDRELAALREGLDDHFREVGRLLESLRRDGEALAERLDWDARDLGGKPGPTRGIEIETDAPAEAPHKEPPAPRDYADGKGGTLSEDFGLRQSGEAPQPPRY
ncbi:YhcB family protein [Halomonas ramblicola]|uniref:YhcB family protein n=1 Tax=Halomonas ramblicola TaxID=747349 RepID=UPI0025B3C94A|nr:DUF1043 family protein [Halomonas ramblicola]MDN3522370.1 DUF1043 family protein [Halomonas ramblicola]